MSAVPARRGRLFVIAAPSGAGKTTLVARAAGARAGAALLDLLHHARPQRPTEQHGRDYFFVGRDEFERMVAAGEFLEHAQVFDNCYGTGRAGRSSRHSPPART